MNILTSATVDKGNTPKDIVTIRKFFDSIGIEEYEKNTLNFLSEFLNTYVTDLLNDAKKNMLYANRNKINIEDVKLAVKSKQNTLYKNRPDVIALRDLATIVNDIPLPGIPDSTKVLLPPIENNLLRNNFQIYNEDIAKYYVEKKETSTMKPEDMTMLGLKRKDVDSKGMIKGNKKRIRLSVTDNQPHKHRKLSLTQAYKPKEEEGKKKEDEEEEDGDDPIFENDDEENAHESNKKDIKGSSKKKEDTGEAFEPFKGGEEDEDDLNDFDFQ